MNRRKAVKNLAIASGGLITLPFWIGACGISDKNTHSSSFSPAQQDILAKITDTIIPAGNPILPVGRQVAIGSIGALSVGVDKFLQKLIDDCYEKEVQDNVKSQIMALERSSKTIYGKSFTDCTQALRQELLLKLSVSPDKAEKDFFSLIKSETIRGFTTSQEVMQKYLNYNVAPGHYYGCADLKA